MSADCLAFSVFAWTAAFSLSSTLSGGPAAPPKIEDPG